MLTLDHFVVGSRDLAAGRDWMSRLLGAAPTGGGQHPLMGTHNALWRVGAAYLEVIAIDPAAPAPDRPRWYGLDRAETHARLQDGPSLLTWVLASDDPEPDFARLAPAVGQPIAVARGDLSWRLTVPDDGTLPAGGALPAVIAWDPGSPPPSQTLPDSGIGLVGFTISAPAETLRQLIDLDLPDEITCREGPLAFSLTLSRPDGSQVELRR